MSGEKIIGMHEVLKVLKQQQLWPQTQNDSQKSFYFRFAVSIALASPLWIGMLLHLLMALRSDLEIDISEDIGVITSMVGCHIALLTFVYYNKDTTRLYKELQDFQRFGRPDNFNKTCRFLNLFSKYFLTYYVSAAYAIYGLSHLIQIPICRKRNEEKNLHEICGTFLPIWAPFDVDFAPVKQIIFIVQFLGTFFIIRGGATVSFAAFEASHYVVLKIQHLKSLLRHVFTELEEDIRHKRLTECIKYHVDIIRIHNLYDESIKRSNGAYTFTVGIAIGSLSNQYLTDHNIGALLHLMGWICCFFLNCQGGQAIFSESLTIADAAYDSSWQDAPLYLQKGLLLVILRSQRALELHAYPVGVMGFALFISLIKLSYSYFALLNQSM